MFYDYTFIPMQHSRLDLQSEVQHILTTPMLRSLK